MTEIVLYIAASLDGFIAKADGAVDWLEEFDDTGAEQGYADFYGTIDGLLMGSRTYEQVLGFGEWPYPDKPCWVFSQRPLATPRPEVTVTNLGPAELMPELAARDVGRAWLVGGGELVATFRRQGLISEYIITIIPIILGEGIPLFISPGPGQGLNLIDSRKLGGGLVELHFVPE